MSETLRMVLIVDHKPQTLRPVEKIRCLRSPFFPSELIGYLRELLPW